MELELWVRPIFLISYQLLRQISMQRTCLVLLETYTVKIKKEFNINLEDEIIIKTLIQEI